MDGSDPRRVHTCEQDRSRMPLWIIEYIWVHKMTDIEEILEPSCWPEMDPEPLTLEDSWRLRVASAQIYSIVKNREIKQFERVMAFLENTYGLHPRLVPSIKHMKIMFGLKTMVIMWMLREGRGMVDTLLKINLFFSSELPQYQDHCNHLEEHYGEHYAQKVEDRLLHYLNQLEAVLPGDTYIDKLLKKNNPETEEEKMLLEVINSDSTTIATTLKKLLHCDGAPCCQRSVSQSSGYGKNGMKTSQLDKFALHASSSISPPAAVDDKTAPELQPRNSDVSKDSSLLLESEHNSDVRIHTQTGGCGEIVNTVKERSSGSASPQFCSKHQRWVKSILQECPDQHSEELQLQSSFTLSPLLFQSSSSTTSSQDLTPSDLIPPPSDQQGPSQQTTTHLQTAAQALGRSKPEGSLSSGSPVSADTSLTQNQPQPCSSRHNLLPTFMLPVVRLVDITSFRCTNRSCSPHQASPNHITMSSYEQAASPFKSQALTPLQCHSGESSTVLHGATNQFAICRQETPQPGQKHSISEDAASLSNHQASTLQSVSRPSERRTHTCTTSTQSQDVGRVSQNTPPEQLKATVGTNCPSLPDDLNASGPPTEDADTSASQSVAPFSVHTAYQTSSSAELSQHPHICITPFQSKTVPCSVVTPRNSICTSVRYETNRVQNIQTRISETSQTLLLQSKLLQPSVSLTRLSLRRCYQVTNGRCATTSGEAVVQGRNHDRAEKKRMEEEEYSNLSFDLNLLYSSYSSSTDVEESLDRDPDYEPHIKKKRRN
ncbi:uncharacterized protein [Antennarius striatus]|uniref:uncharacterized protein n=1 Tax=Antennarius striatus TaxID=241820 RepID=UPI0035B3B5AC